MMFTRLGSGCQDPLTNSFWAAPLQRRMFGRLRMISDALVTTTQRYQQLLGASARSGPQAVVLNVFSNVGEPDLGSATDERPSRMVIFGGMGSAQLGGATCGRDRRSARSSRNYGDSSILASAASRCPVRSIVSRLSPAVCCQPPMSVRTQAKVGSGTLPYPNRSVLGKSPDYGRV